MEENNGTLLSSGDNDEWFMVNGENI